MTLQALQQHITELQSLFAAYSFWASTLFVFLLALASSLPTPLVALFCIAAGALYGFTMGIVIVMLGCGVGASLTFYCLRRLGLSSLVQRRFAKQLAVVEQYCQQGDFWYAVALRLVPGIPFFVVNTGLSLTNMSYLKFLGSMLLGMLVMFAILVNAGKQITQIDSMQTIFTPSVLVSLLAMAVFVFLSRLFWQKVILAENHIGKR